MYLTEKSHLPSFSPFRAVGKRSAPNNFDLISRSFDENILRRLKTLNSSSNPPSISLSWLSLAVDFLSSTHAEAQTLISNLRSSAGSSDESLALYLDHSVKLLDICNSISSEIERLRQRRLLINFVLHLFESSGDNEFEVPTTDKLRRARDSLSNWENYSRGSAKRRGFQIHDPDVLIRDLAAGIGSAPPRGKISSVGKLVRRTIYAVGLLTVFVAGIAVSTLYGIPEIGKVVVPAEFIWGDALEEMKRRLFEGERKGSLAEVDDVATRVRGMRDIIDGVVVLELGGGSSNVEVKKERLKSGVKELETVTERFSEVLERLSNGVNGMFHTVLCTRNGVLENFRVGHHEKQPRK